MAVYGAMLASTSAGASVSIERAAGWSRQLRLTPLRPPAYVAVKLLAAMVLGGIAVAVAYVAGSVAGARMSAHVWVETAVLGWLCSLVFAAFGLFMGYLLPSENVMQVIGPLLAVMAFASGLFVPVNQLGSTFATIAKFIPTYGVGQLARYPPGPRRPARRRGAQRPGVDDGLRGRCCLAVPPRQQGLDHRSGRTVTT